MPFITVQGNRLFYDMQGSGHPIVFLHGHALDSRMWEAQMGGLKRLYTVVSYDMRGHGQSQAPATGYSRGDYAEELFGLIEGLGFSKPSLVGHSMGGGVALEYALRHPDRCSTLTLMSGSLEGYADPESVSAMLDKQKRALRRGGVNERFLRAAMLSPIYVGIRRDAAKSALVRGMLSAWSSADWLDTAVYPPPERLQIERLSDLRVPALVVVGENDPPVFHEIADVLSGAITVVRKVILADCGHMAPIEQPEAVNDNLMDFIGGAAGKALL